MKILFRLAAILLCTAGLKLHAGNLKVNLAPAAAVNAGAQWRVDGGAWKNSGASVNGLPNGNHTVDFKTISGWIAPNATSVSISNGSKTITGTYVAAAALKITLNPMAGQWRIDNGAWRSSGTTVSNLAPGSHTINYAAVAGYSSPIAETVSLNAGQTTSLTRNYAALAQVSVTLSPAIAQWRVDDGPWQASGAIAGNLSVGTHIISYSTISGYASPTSESVTLTGGQTLSLSRSYIQLAQLTVTLSPATAQWHLDAGAWQSSGASLPNLSLGNHTLEYAPSPGYLPPPSETITLVGGANNISRSYTQLASFGVELDPVNAQWRLDGGPWQSSGTVLANLSLGAHTVEFSPYAGYVTPQTETVTLVGGSNPTLMRSYQSLQSASLTVTLDPANAQWRLDGGSWQASGGSLGNLAAGLHSLEFSEVAGHATLPPQTITLTANTHDELNFTYPLFYEVVKNFPDAGATSSIIQGSDGVIYGISNSEGGMAVGLLFKINADGSGYAVLRNFGGALAGHAPVSLMEGTDGMLYGTTNLGGPTNTGTIFRVSKTGSAYEPIRIFTAPSEGLNPNSLVEGSDGWLYGTTTKGGAFNEGVVFKLGKDGNSFAVLRHFSGAADGKAAVGLVEGPLGALYGTTQSGGANAFGVVFKINKNGTNFAVLKHFAGGIDGAAPRGSLLNGSDGVLYGSTSTGGTFNRGTVFRLNYDGSGHAVIKNFLGDATESGAPSSQLQEDATGTLYGTATSAGPGGRGSIFKLSKDGTGFALVKAFPGGTAEGGLLAFQNAPLAISNGVIHGVARFGGEGNRGTLFRVDTNGGNFSVLKQLGAPYGSLIMTSVVEGSDGVLYGTSILGGVANNGVIYRVNKDGTGLAVLRSFASADGQKFGQGVIESSSGALITFIGEDLTRLNKDGSGFAIIRSFPADVSWPEGVIEGSDGALYGTMGGGGSAGTGSLFKINQDGTGYSLLHSFNGGPSDGKFPTVLVEAANGNLYGMTNGGGSADKGIVFTVKKDGTGYSILKHFTGGPDGGSPRARLTAAADGFIYGTTVAGGSANQGVIFKMAPDGSTYVVLHNFVMNTPSETNETYAGVTEKNGLLYGVTFFGGTLNYGTAFRLSTDGTGYTTLVNFGAGETDGAVPAATLTLGRDGFLYGTTARGLAGATIFVIRPN